MTLNQHYKYDDQVSQTLEKIHEIPFASVTCMGAHDMHSKEKVKTQSSKTQMAQSAPSKRP